MLDTLKSGFGGSKQTHKHAEELQTLIAAAREERDALSAMLTQVSARSSNLAEVDKSLKQVSDKAERAHEACEDVSGKIAALDDRLKVFDGIDHRIEMLLTQVADAQKVTEKLTAPDGDFQKHRQAVNQLASQALETHATIDTLRKERGVLEDLRAQLRQAQNDMKDSAKGAAALRSEIEGVRAAAGELNDEHERIREISRSAREEALATSEAVRDIEKKLGPLVEVQELSKTTEERLAALNALAEHVSHKTKALEAQKQAVDHATVQANRLNEMVWAMDVQINKLGEGQKQVQKTEETLAKMEQLAQDTEAHLQGAITAREDFSREFTRLENESRSLAEYLRQNVERLALEKKEFDAFDERLRALQSGISEAEGRMEAVLANDKDIASLSKRLDAIDRSFGALAAQADELAQKQNALESLAERLAEVDELGTRTATQYDALMKSRVDVEQLRNEISDFHRSHAEVAQLSDKLASDRAALDAFGERASSLLARTPELEVRMDAVLGKMPLVEDATRSAARLDALTTELDAHLTRVGARLEFVERLETRVNDLHVVTSEVDHKLAEQLARRNELDLLKNALDTVGAQALDVEQKLEGIGAVQQKLVPLASEAGRLAESVARTQQLVQSVHRDEETVLAQRVQLIELVEQSRALAIEAADRLKQAQSVSDEVTRARAIKDELLAELAEVQARQSEAVAQTEAAADQLKRAEAMVRHLEQRRSQLAFAEKKIAMFEARVNDLTADTESIDQKIKTIAEREALVQAIKAEVEAVHEISSRSRADLNFVAEHRNDVATLRAQVEDLLGRVSDTDQKVAAIEARRKMVEDVQSRTIAITNLLDDINVNLEMLGEQKAVIDHVGEKLARLDFMVQEAQNTLRTLQREREVAERIEKSIKSLRSRPAVDAKTA